MRERPLRLGIIAPPWFPVPPPAYGGTEVVVDYLARGLSARGHEVRLFTIAASTTPVARQHLYTTPAGPIGAVLPEAAHALAAYDALGDADIIHDHTVLGPLLAMSRPGRRPPIVITHHGPFTLETRRVFGEIARHAFIVSISRSQAKSAGEVPIAAVIHHGIDLEVYQPGPGGGGYLLFVGRMCAEKGVHSAVRIAKRAGRRLRLVTKMREPAERAYFERRVKPLLGPDDDMPVELPLPRRIQLLQHADALVNPIEWPEPFGLVMAEALATGTPVLAYGNGAAPELVDHGVTGYLCSNEDEMVAAVPCVPAIDRAACRQVAAERFSLARMARDHELLYRRILDGALAVASPHPPSEPVAQRDTESVVPAQVSGSPEPTSQAVLR